MSRQERQARARAAIAACDIATLSPTPPAFIKLKEEAERLLKLIEARTARPVQPIGGVMKPAEVLLQSALLMVDYQSHVDGLSYDISDLTFVLYGAPGDKPDIVGAMAGIEEHIDSLLRQRRRIRSWRTKGLGSQGRDLLVAMYDHLLGEVRTWLETVVTTVLDPMGSARARGEMTHPSVVKIVMRADFTLSPNFDDLEAWAERCPKTL